MTTTLIVIAKEPVPGRVKTRLVPPLSHDQAARLAAAALADTLHVAEQAGFVERVLAFDGDPDGWRRPGWRVVPQPGGSLDLRLTAAFAAVDGPVLLIGMDTPQVSTRQLLAFEPDRYDACLGRSTDGGYWTIGFADPRVAAAAIPGVPMSTPSTGQAQFERLRGLGLRIQELDTLTDVDTFAAAEQVAAVAPGTAFATALAATKVLAS